MTIASIGIIASGGALGAILRVFATQRITHLFPHFTQSGTLAVNIIGSLLIGLIWGLGERFEMSLSLRLFIISGGLGAFTTFSTYALDTLSLAKNKGLGTALIYIALSNILSLGAVVVGHWLGNRL